MIKSFDIHIFAFAFGIIKTHGSLWNLTYCCYHITEVYVKQHQKA